MDDSTIIPPTAPTPKSTSKEVMPQTIREMFKYTGGRCGGDEVHVQVRALSEGETVPEGAEVVSNDTPAHGWKPLTEESK